MALTTILPSGLNSANDFSSLVPAAYSQANAAFSQANAAFNQANTGAASAAAFTQANNAYDTANSAGSFANGAFVTANSGASFANGAFTKANNALANTTGTFGGNLTVSGNLNVVGTGTSAITFADGSMQYTANAADAWTRTQANNAYDKANSAGSFANGAFNQSNTYVWPQANSAASFANGAFLAANSGASFANGAFLAANSGASFANGAFVTANSATTTATSGASFANGAFTQANSNYTSAVTKLLVTAPSMYYSVDQYSGNNPTIYIRAGETIAFFLDNVSGHPFMLRETAGGTNYSTGLTHVSTSGVVTTGSGAQGQTTGTIYWKVPFVLAGLTYVYQCSVHSGMVGNIVIDQPTAIAFLTANAAYTAQNTTAGFANAAFNTANAAFNTANASYTSQNTTAIFANAAFIHANAAFDKANTGTTALDTNSDIVAFTIAFS